MFRLLSVLSVAAATISNCGSASTRFQLTALDFQPANPVPGSDVFMTVEFQNPGTTVTDGKAHRTVTLNGLPVVDETVSLCNEATSCPLTAGFNNRSALSAWPDVKGKIVSTIRWSATSGEELLCIKTSVSSAMGPRLRGGAATVVSADVIQHLAQPVFVHSTEVALRSEVSLLGSGGQCAAYSVSGHHWMTLANRSWVGPELGAMSA